MRIVASRILCCGGNRQIHMDYRNPVEENGLHDRSLSQRAPRPPPGQAFIVFLGTLHQGCNIYYAQVCFGWLSFTDNKGEDVAKYIKEGYLQM